MPPKEFVDQPFVVLRLLSGDWFTNATPYSYVVDERGKIQFHGRTDKAAKVVEELMADAGYDVKLAPNENK